MTTDQFNLAIRQHVNREFKSMVTDLQQSLCLEGLRRVVQRTPVDTGQAKGGWQVGIDDRPEGQIDRLDPSGATTIEEGSAEIKKLKAYGTCHITNNVAHIVPLEDGHSPQGSHMVASTLNELA